MGCHVAPFAGVGGSVVSGRVGVIGDLLAIGLISVAVSREDFGHGEAPSVEGR